VLLGVCVCVWEREREKEREKEKERERKTKRLRKRERQRERENYLHLDCLQHRWFWKETDPAGSAPENKIGILSITNSHIPHL